MTGWRWRVQARVPHGVFGWITKVDHLNREAAAAEADSCAAAHPEWEWRILDDSTAEVAHVEKVSAA